ncbi:class I SAM-dependent rRNA methyltransferase [Gorillibacterium massiliense]|uniref:class I SAM-dependent rRNA methyltransferase n=1 Tax=Gorillibacterium massiliense TaxID=1280390 RepID=UPI0004B80B29|nr:class I SAM-dependent rRNA methyltransferase [Gorillibacterium massiliense]
MAAVYLLKNRKKRVEQGHPWIFQNEVERVEGEPAPGSVLPIYNHLGQYVASGYYNPKSQIVVRVVSTQPLTAMDRDSFIARFRECKSHRSRFLPDADACRMVYGEADFLPGLIVDKFADVLVVQLLTLGMDVCREAIAEALKEVFQPAAIYERSDVPVREREGLEMRKGPIFGECPDRVQITENGLRIVVDVREGQKTGYFFDQRENRAAIKPLMLGWGTRSGIHLEEREEDGELRHVPVNANGKEVTFPYWDGANVLECFSHTGSFTLNACKYGAKKVTCLDISEHAVESAKRNVELNGFQDRVEFVVADAFDYLRTQVKGVEERKLRGTAAEKKVDTSKPLTPGGRTWDVVILDPPAFAKSRSAVEGACRGYKDINLHGMKLVNEGGYLVTASCSFHVSPERFLDTIHEAAADAGKVLRLLDFRAAGKDHPRILGVDEGNYLKFAIFEVRSR